MFLYLIGNEKLKVYKIGITASPRKRERQIQQSFPFSLQIIAQCELQMPAGSESSHRRIALAVEKEMHRHFSNLCIRGEWFHKNQEEGVFGIRSNIK